MHANIHHLDKLATGTHSIYMSLTVFLIVLFAAAMHATWNAIVKSGTDTFFTAILVTTSAGMISVAILPFIPQPAMESWPNILISVALQVVYFSLVSYIYRIADMGLAYPLMRGSAPVIVAWVSTLCMAEALSNGAWFGVACVCVGVLSLALAAKGKSGRGVVLALLTAAVIASYTLVDGIGVRKSHAPLAYALWIFTLTAIPLAGWGIVRQRQALWQYARKHARIGVIGGFGAAMSYGLALWAMTLAPVAIVAALRETAILFAIAIAVFILKERLTWERAISGTLIATGAILLRLA
jgi:drug/metabolite transporter (DMT)-like permease